MTGSGNGHTDIKFAGTHAYMGCRWQRHRPQASAHWPVDMLSSLSTHCQEPHYSPTFCCSPRMKEIAQDEAMPGWSRHTDRRTDYITAFHLASCRSRTHSHALLTWTMRLHGLLNACRWVSNSEYLKTKLDFESIRSSVKHAIWLEAGFTG